MKEYHISKNDANQRLDRFLIKTLSQMPMSLLSKYIRIKKIKVNHKRALISQRLQENDTIQCFIKEEFYEQQQSMDFLKVPRHLSIIYEDEDIVIIDKESGLLSHKSSDLQDNVQDRFLHYLFHKKEFDPLKVQSFLPCIAHRLDRNTQGLMIACKNAASLRSINEAFKNHWILKKYVCIVEGELPKKADHLMLYHKKLVGNIADVVEVPCEGYQCMESAYQVLDSCSRFSLVEVTIFTGKSHQIRALMQYLKHPILHDVKYGAKKDGSLTYQVLCSYRLQFQFPKGHNLQQLNQKDFKLESNKVFAFYRNLKKGIA